MEEIRYRRLTFMGYSYYRVGTDGSFWSCLINRMGFGPWKRLRLDDYRPDGYFVVKLSKNKDIKKMLLHRIVLLAFVGECPPGMECRHLDGNPKNNCLANLEWGTPKENGQDKIRHDTQVRGEQNGVAVLTDDIVREIRKLREKNYSYQKIADHFSVSRGAVQAVIYKRTWNHVV